MRRIAVLVLVLGVLGAATGGQAGAATRPSRGDCRGWSAPTAPTGATGPSGATGPAGPTASAAPPTTTAPVARDRRPARAALRTADRCLKLDQVQVIGSHNSYHLQPAEPLFSALRGFSSALADSIEYSHAPLPEQFQRQGVRQIELDLWTDPQGGLYSTRHINSILGLPTASGIPALDEPGIKVQHIAEIDFRVTCVTFVTCLRQVKGWSDAHPGHLPIAILLELKADPTPDPVKAGFVTPLPWGAKDLDGMDAEIRSVFGARDLITPDSVRGKHPTLDAAVRAGAWPTLGASRGKVMFLMDNSGELRDLYLQGHPALRGRVVFTNADPGAPDAAFVKRNDPMDPTIPDLVRAGYVVRTRADADTVQARTNDTSMRDAALASGAQWVSTDYPVPGMSAQFGTDYVAMIPDGHPARCNPVNTGPACRNDALELLRR